MKFKKEYESFAKAVSQLNDVMVDKAVNDIERETTRFFYWIMSQIILKMNGSIPVKKYNRIELYAGIIGENNRVLVQYGRVSSFLSDREITPKEFFKIMKEIETLFNSFSNYGANYLHEKNSNVASLVIFTND